MVAGGGGERISQEIQEGVHTATFKLYNQQGPTVYSTWNSVQCYAAAQMGGEFGGEWIYIYVWLNPFALYLELSQHCLLISYTPIQTKKLKFLKKSMVLAQKQKYRSMVQDRQSRDKPMHLWLPSL